MITLRPLVDDDIPVIKSWPPYPPAFAMLDYALRDGGWLDGYYRRDGTEILVAEREGTIVGFSILSRDPEGSAEFRIALHPDALGRGLGRLLAILTLRHGFMDPALHAIRLIVRKNNPRARRLYESLGFSLQGECVEEVRGERVAFYRMTINRDIFEGVEST